MTYAIATLILSLSGLLPAQDGYERLNDVPDAVSVTLPADDSFAAVRYEMDGKWSAWTTLAVENEQDPLLRESNMMMFPPSATAVEIDATDDVTVHPIDVSHAPVSYEVAAVSKTETPRILAREEWGADASLLIRKTDPSDSPADTANAGDNGGATNARVEECKTAQLNYPDEFKTTGKTVQTDEYGRALRWPHTYSKDIDLIAVHHTAVAVAGDARSGAERVRALYSYHANNRGWGDIGYHYLIDEDGQIYEGKSGGKYVVAGHAYCNNIGTLGIALLGNFEGERPTQDQLKALQWLIDELADEYDIDLDRDVTFHGKALSPVVGHRDLLSTDCPGYFVYGAMAQIRKNAASGDVYASVTLPARRVTVASRKPAGTLESRTEARRQERLAASRSKDVQPRAVQRLLNSAASRLLMRKLRRNVDTSTARTRPTAVAAASRTERSASSARSSARSSDTAIRIRLTRQETGASSCDTYDLPSIRRLYRGEIDCVMVDDAAAIINTVDLEEYLIGLAEEPDTEPYEKQRAFAIAARTYAMHYSLPENRKFPGKPYDGDDSPARFQLYGGKAFEGRNPRWAEAVHSTAHRVLMKDNRIIRPPYFSSDDGRTRTPADAGWGASFPFAEIFTAKDDPWCEGMGLRGHGVGMSGCGAKGQALEGKAGEEILAYYYPGTEIVEVR